MKTIYTFVIDTPFLLWAVWLERDGLNESGRVKLHAFITASDRERANNANYFINTTVGREKRVCVCTTGFQCLMNAGHFELLCFFLCILFYLDHDVFYFDVFCELYKCIMTITFPLN